jgi:hypothetical protein
MIVQKLNSGGLRLIEQHQHALISGALAHAWTGLGPQPQRLSHRLVMACGLHDMPWLSADKKPIIDTEGVVDFVRYPLQPRLDLYQSGIDELEAVDTYVALMTSAHYLRLMRRSATPAFLQHEEARQKRLLALLPPDSVDVQGDLFWVRLFDTLSLYLCMTPPQTNPEDHPGWLAPPRWARLPQGQRFDVHWADPRTLTLDPFPLEHSLELAIPCTELAPCQDSRALMGGLKQDQPSWWRVCVTKAAHSPP